MPELPRQSGRGAVGGRSAPQNVLTPRPGPQTPQNRPSGPQPIQPPDVQRSIAEFFRGLRRALGLSPHRAAAYLLTHADAIEALETGAVWQLPAWPETVRIVTAYSAAAGVDGRPALAAIAELMRRGAPPQKLLPPAADNRMPMQMQMSSKRLRRAGSAIKEGARRLPRDAMNEARQRPARALYTMALPVGIVIVLLNTSVLQSAVSHLPGSFVHMLESSREMLSAYWAPVRDGHRWIEVDDPRQRRGDKLQNEKLQITGR